MGAGRFLARIWLCMSLQMLVGLGFSEIPYIGVRYQHADDYRAEATLMNWENYQPHLTIYNWMEHLAQEHKFVNLLTIGKSFNGIDLKAMVLSKGQPKKAIWVDAGIHPREWLSIATCTYFMKHLVKIFDSNIVSSLTEFAWHFMPVLNVDGYKYTWEQDRLWRRTRSDPQTKSCQGPTTRSLGFKLCVGVDPNRNFGFQWEGSLACEDGYSGPWPHSECCVQAMTGYVINASKTMEFIASFNLHSYGELWLTPYAWTDIPPADDADLTRVALQGTTAMNKIRGSNYRVGRAGTTVYKAHGTALDWFYGARQVPFAYTLELGNGNYGFMPPATEIREVGDELVAGISAAVEGMKYTKHHN